MKYTVPILILFLLGLWILGGTWLYNKSCCAVGAVGTSNNTGITSDANTNTGIAATNENAVAPVTPPPAPAKVPLIIKDGVKEVANSEDNFSFIQSNNRPIIPAKTNKAFGDLAAYLNNNPKRKLVLTGRYKSTEKQVNPNLGIARAEEVKRKLVTMKVKKDQIETKGKMDNALTFENNKTQGGVDFDFADLVTGAATGDDATADAGNANAGIKTPPLVINGPGLRIREADNISFPQSSYEYNKPLSPKVGAAYKKVGDYMGKNADKQLKITGIYSKEEENKSLLPTLGLARANNVKQALIKAGVPSQQIATADQERSNLKFPDGNLQGGVRYQILNAPKPATNADGSGAGDPNAARLAQIEKDLKAGPITVYFQTAKTELVMNPKTRKQFSDLIFYMDQKSNARVDVTGHTDNVGSDEANMKYGEGRAKFVTEYMVKNGLPGKRITANSKGESQPIVANDTPANKAKNRRVEVRLK